MPLQGTSARSDGISFEIGNATFYDIGTWMMKRRGQILETKRELNTEVPYKGWHMASFV